MVSVVVLALYSTWMSLVVVYPLYVAYTVMSPVWVMVMLPFASIVAHEPPDDMLHVGVTVSWLYLATTFPEVPCIVSEASMKNWLSYDTVMVWVFVFPPKVQEIVNYLSCTPVFMSILPFWLMVAYW